jgi:hypothetical protein
MHAKMHDKFIKAEVPSLPHRLEYKIRDSKLLPENLRNASLLALKNMPDGDRLCHGDLHPGNIIISQPKPVIIDWIDASIGNPLADVASTSILTQGMAEAEPQFSRLQRLGLRIMHTIYLRRYFQMRPGGYDEYQCWLPIVEAARLNENVPGWDDWLLKQASTIC